MPYQRKLLAGMNCLPGQLDLFPTDGPPEPFVLPHAREYCAYCGVRLDEAHEVQTGSDGSRYCGRDCRFDGENELWEMRAYPPRYV